MNYTAKLIEQFVSALNNKYLEPLLADEVPVELRTKALADNSEMFEWEIRRVEANPWIAPLQARLPTSFPRLYQFLVSHFRFAEFEIGPMMFFANTGEVVYHELADAIFRDEALYPLLLEHGLLQFGRDWGGGYDPVCFAMERRKRGDAPIVQIDHEEVLMRHRIRVIAEIAPSFEQFVHRAIAGELEVR